MIPLEKVKDINLKHETLRKRTFFRKIRSKFLQKNQKNIQI